MPENVPNPSSLLRKTLTAILLPIIMIIWIIGWMLANIEHPIGSVNSTQKLLRTHHTFSSQVEEIEEQNEDKNINNKTEIAT